MFVDFENLTYSGKQIWGNYQRNVSAGLSKDRIYQEAIHRHSVHMTAIWECYVDERGYLTNEEVLRESLECAFIMQYIGYTLFGS